MDPILLEQVLVNLLENAVQHARGMEHLRLQVSLQGSTVSFEVVDDGCGVPSQRIPELFSGTLLPEGASCDQQKHNMGIGLSVCATIVKAHGGQIYAKRVRPKGMCFGFTLEAEEVIHE